MADVASKKGQFSRNMLLDYLVILAAAVLHALNYEVFILPNAFAPAGINGIATMIQYLFDFSVGYMSLIINVPLAIFAFFKVSRQFAVRTFLFSLVFSLSLLVFKNGYVDVSAFVYSSPNGNSQILAPIASGALTGLLYVLLMRRNASSGGTDIIARYVTKFYPDFSMSWLMFGLNSVVALLSYFVYDFNIEPVILCIIYCFLASQVSDSFLKGGKQALKFEVVTMHADEISKILIRDLHHSVTIVPAKGAYTDREKNLLICVVNKHQISRFTEILAGFPDTFACMSYVNETVGNFRKIKRT